MDVLLQVEQDNLKHSFRSAEVHSDVEPQHQLATLFEVQRTRTILVSLVEVQLQPTEQQQQKKSQNSTVELCFRDTRHQSGYPHQFISS